MPTVDPEYRADLEILMACCKLLPPEKCLRAYMRGAMNLMVRHAMRQILKPVIEKFTAGLHSGGLVTPGKRYRVGERAESFELPERSKAWRSPYDNGRR